ncbi:hypothetical protein V8E36_003196 [Tilletia maclaganii]
MAAEREWTRKLNEAQDSSNEGARLEFAKKYNAAFSTYIRAGESYLWLIRHFDQRPGGSSSSGGGGGDADELKARLRRAANKVLERAELIKSLRKEIVPPAHDILSQEAQHLILSQSSALGSSVYPLWQDAPAASAQAVASRRPESQPALAISHLERRAQFRRAAQTAGGPCLINYESPLRGRDIVQDVVTDCSFVAALQVAAEYDRRWSSKIATAALHPRDAHDRATTSEDGRYAVKLYFNGGARRVVVDNQLPCFPNGTLIGAASVRNDQFWPALVEKAFLKVMGGYDFPGSNSAADLHTLTGWLPEQVLLQQAGFRREQSWRTLHTAFLQGRCILTVGTGANGPVGRDRDRERGWKWLSPAHNYAVLDVREQEGQRQMVVVNSWRKAPREAATEQQQTRSPSDLPSSLAALQLAAETEQSDEEVRVLSWEDICVRFDTIHVNWRLSDFPYSQAVHCAWEARNDQIGLSQNAQLQITLDWSQMARPSSSDPQSDGAELWLHLNRHMTDRTPDSALIAIHAFNHAEGRKIYQLTDREQMGAFTDSSHALHKMRVQPDCQAVTVIASQYGANRETSFSLYAYGPVPMTIRALPRAYPFKTTASGSWAGRSAGGNLAQTTFGFNPQFVVDIEDTSGASTADVSLLIMAETARMVPLQVMLFHSNGGRRVEQVEEPDIIMSSGMYTHAVAMAERRSLDSSLGRGALPAFSTSRAGRGGIPPGRHTLIVSTFAPGVEGDFFLTVESSHRLAALRPIPQEGAGMFHRALRGKWDSELGTAAGGPMAGPCASNPCWKIEVPKGGAVLQMLHQPLLFDSSSPANQSRNMAQKQV